MRIVQDIEHVLNMNVTLLASYRQQRHRLSLVFDSYLDGLAAALAYYMNVGCFAPTQFRQVMWSTWQRKPYVKMQERNYNPNKLQWKKCKNDDPVKISSKVSTWPEPAQLIQERFKFLHLRVQWEPVLGPQDSRLPLPFPSVRMHPGCTLQPCGFEVKF